MAMGITLLNSAALSVMTLAQVAKESKSTTWSIWAIMEEGEMGSLPIAHGNVREGQVPILFVPSVANFSKSFLACLNHLLHKGISLGMIFSSPMMVNESMVK